jgi:hypothetical protein
VVWGNPPTTFAWSLPVGSFVVLAVLVLVGAATTGALWWARGGPAAAVAGSVVLLLVVISAWAVRRELRSRRVGNHGLLACGRIVASGVGSTENGLRFELTIDLPGTPLYHAVADHSYARDTEHMPENPRPGLLVPVRVDRADRGFVLVDWRVAGARGWKRADGRSS